MLLLERQIRLARSQQGRSQLGQQRQQEQKIQQQQRLIAGLVG
jgi:hypothetical protein